MGTNLGHLPRYREICGKFGESVPREHVCAGLFLSLWSSAILTINVHQLYEEDLLEIISGVQAKPGRNNLEPESKSNLVMAQYKNVLGIRGDNTPEHARYLGYLDVKELYPDVIPTSLETFIRHALEEMKPI